jgi:hypothetical protein
VRSVRTLAVLALASLALFPAGAAASPYTDVLRVYQAQGSVPPCRFSSPQLAAALRGVDAYGQQYFADFGNAVESALAARAAGACIPGHRLSPSGSLSPAVLPASPTSATGAGPPLPLLLLGGLTVFLVIAAGVGALARGAGWEPGWAAAWRHACGEAGYRLSGGRARLNDRWRLRR